MSTKVLIVDDHPAVREGLAVRISSQPDMEVCGQAADLAESMKMIDTTCPNVVVVDIHLKGSNGLDLITRIKDRDKTVRFLVCSMYPDVLYAQRALRAGALGYINKENTTGHIVEAIRRVRDGQIYVSDEIAQRMLARTVVGRKPYETSGVDSLSARELEVFRLFGQALSAGEIAQRLHRSPHTIEAHRQAIKRKLNVKTAAELNRISMQWMLENR